MTPEQIIQWVREATSYANFNTPAGKHEWWALNFNTRFAQLARADMQEQCAKVCDEWTQRNHVYVNGAIQCAAAIRALKD